MILTFLAGVVVLPLTGSAACPGLCRGSAGGGLWGRERARDLGPGWSGRACGRPAAGLEQGQPVVLAVPAFGQVQGQPAAAGARDPGGDVDQVRADGGAAGFAVEGRGQAPGGAEEVVRD